MPLQWINHATDHTHGPTTVVVDGGGPHTHDDYALTVDANAHLTAPDPHVAYALDADLANHETEGHVHVHDYAAPHLHPYASDVHTHAGGAHPDLTAHTDLGLAGSGHAHTGTYEPVHAHPYAATVHGHVVADTTNLQASLDGKSATGHTHAYEPSGTVATHAGAADPHPGYLTPAEGNAAYSATNHVHAGGSQAFPVGAVFIAVVATNPATLLGYGTWAAFAAGRVLVGLDAAQTEFDTVEETGGAKTHTLSAAEMPAHTHIVTSQTATTGSATSYEHGTLDTSSAEAEATEVTGSTGGGGAHNNLQPYVVVYMWKRTG